MFRRTMMTVIGGALFLCAAMVAAAADKPNFSGEWKLNIDKSNFGPIPPPNSQVMTIDHQDPQMTTTTDSDGMDGKTNFTVKYKTDGTEAVNEIRGTQAKTTGKWEGEALVVVTKLEVQGMEITLNNTMKLAPEGKAISAVTKIITPQGEFEQSLVFDKVQK
jgi:hypothetical protein